MAVSIYAAIDVGSSELSMKIYEVSKSRGIRELNHVRRDLNLGAETYSKGLISYQTTDEICRTLNDFKRVMADFGTEAWQVYSTSGLREAANALVVIDQIKIQTGFKVKILSNSEARFLYYKALALKEENFDSMIQEGTLIVDIGAGSLQLSLFDKGVLCVTQNLLLGSTRIRELLQAMEGANYDFQDLISEYVERDLYTFKKLYLDLMNINIQCIIAVGGMIPEIYRRMTPDNPEPDVSFYDKILSRTALSLGIPNSHINRMIPTILLCRKISQITGCERLHLSAIDLCDSMVAEYAEKKVKLLSKHDFTSDILSTSQNIARKYKVDEEHVATVQELAMQIFDRIRKLHGLGKRERLLLQISVILHSCGLYIDAIQSRECSYRIIMSTEIIGLSHRERAMVANVVRYNSSIFPPYSQFAQDFTRDEYITMVKLNAILITANVLDKSNRHKIHTVGVTLKDGVLTITADTMADITLERGLFYRKAYIFQEVFGIRPVLKQKRSGKK